MPEGNPRDGGNRPGAWPIPRKGIDVHQGSEPVANAVAGISLGQRSRYRTQALAALSQVGEVVYAMRVAGGLVKIGHTTQAGRRRAALKGEILAVTFGSRTDEQAIHARLADHIHHGREWYYPTPGVMAVVNEMRAAMGMDPLAA
jgi:hypothetical protein